MGLPDCQIHKTYQATQIQALGPCGGPGNRQFEPRRWLLVIHDVTGLQPAPATLLKHVMQAAPAQKMPSSLRGRCAGE
jgi:hypothetical protein